jgi:2-polyprenyl-6-methoxyphenol hydroxylase-like FAD-dependent oxidoreductase
VAQDADLAAVTGRLRFPQDLVRVRREYGHAGRYGGEGAFLVGDAIHPVSPAGGQGANMSVFDAAALADVLLGNHAAPLREYERRRRHANERSMAFTRAAAAAALRAPSALARLVAPRALALLAGSPALFARFLRMAATAFQDRPRG